MMWQAKSPPFLRFMTFHYAPLWIITFKSKNHYILICTICIWNIVTSDRTNWKPFQFIPIKTIDSLLFKSLNYNKYRKLKYQFNHSWSHLKTWRMRRDMKLSLRIRPDCIETNHSPESQMKEFTSYIWIRFALVN